mmetsp:Transcript_30107/g.97985  ORF Transcript_30107/g.97985 Transcript_30107/m.97985 type:complete len:306 (-) Transcript_30107:71-988(-)
MRAIAVAKWALRFAAGTLSLPVAALGLLCVFQTKLMYVPAIPGEGRKYVYRPDRLNIDAEDVTLVSADGVRVHAWLCKVSDDGNPKPRPTMLFFMSNAGNISHRLTNVARILSHMRCNVLILSYRGYGESEGSANERGIMLDAQAALDYLQTRSDVVDPQRIFIFGRSLGGAVAVALTVANPDLIKAVILENTFTSMADMAGCVFPPFKALLGHDKPLRFLVRERWATRELIGDVKQPILFLVSGRDEMMPRNFMEELFELSAASANKRWVFFPTAHHMDLYVNHKDKYFRAQKEFLVENGLYDV